MFLNVRATWPPRSRPGRVVAPSLLSLDVRALLDHRHGVVAVELQDRPGRVVHLFRLEVVVLCVDRSDELVFARGQACDVDPLKGEGVSVAVTQPTEMPMVTASEVCPPWTQPLYTWLSGAPGRDTLNAGLSVRQKPCLAPLPTLTPVAAL